MCECGAGSSLTDVLPLREWVDQLRDQIKRQGPQVGTFGRELQKIVDDQWNKDDYSFVRAFCEVQSRIQGSDVRGEPRGWAAIRSSNALKAFPVGAVAAALGGASLAGPAVGGAGGAGATAPAVAAAGAGPLLGGATLVLGFCIMAASGLGMCKAWREGSKAPDEDLGKGDQPPEHLVRQHNALFRKRQRILVVHAYIRNLISSLSDRIDDWFDSNSLPPDFLDCFRGHSVLPIFVRSPDDPERGGAFSLFDWLVGQPQEHEVLKKALKRMSFDGQYTLRSMEACAEVAECLAEVELFQEGGKYFGLREDVLAYSRNMKDTHSFIGSALSAAWTSETRNSKLPAEEAIISAVASWFDRAADARDSEQHYELCLVREEERPCVHEATRRYSQVLRRPLLDLRWNFSCPDPFLKGLINGLLPSIGVGGWLWLIIHELGCGGTVSGGQTETGIPEEEKDSHGH